MCRWCSSGMVPLSQSPRQFLPVLANTKLHMFSDCACLKLEDGSPPPDSRVARTSGSFNHGMQRRRRSKQARCRLSSTTFPRHNSHAHAIGIVPSDGLRLVTVNDGQRIRRCPFPDLASTLPMADRRRLSGLRDAEMLS
ncbi:hypothetical protein L226DRAFT_342060 [Lentinus tigrinus ALCF2SS1-7]|uniref:uncharacterized protein n=1 Tax=Lentinus tigrinus ALCF2SS1-7 TaxID=1328758 RepID=UPI0011662215|nr:hypothetical protein L226DRAFT_342060 [Lentinus tigrinus ALCF2SS1-7]